MQVGVVGAGNVARFHVRGYMEAGASIVAVADVDEAKAASVADVAGAQVYSNYEDLLASPDISAVSVCLPNHLHYEACLAALKAGKHVLCEKPMTTTLEDARELVRAADESSRYLQVAYMKRFLPAFQTAHASLPEIGNILTATVKVFHWFPEDMWASADKVWGLKKHSAGGGPLVHAGSHIIDILNWWFGPIASVNSRIRYKPGLDIDDHTAATMITEAGVTIFFECAWLPLSHIGYFKDGWDERIEVTGDRGRVELYSTWWDRTDMSPFVRVYKEGEPAKEIYATPTNGFSAEVRAFVEACGNGGKTKPDAADGLAVQEVIEGLYRSSDKGGIVELKEL